MSCVMPPYDEKKKEGCSMAPQFPHKAQQAENRWLSPLLPSIFGRRELYRDR